ncbi:MAG: FAD-binding protein [Cellvibrionales bacterium]|nr:FAD-binding protein [Cellvibrionales bacterium]
MSQHFDRVVDTLVVGSGNGALTAAITAHDHQGGDVLIVEKADQLGGTSAISGGGIWIPNNHYAKAAGSQDSVAEAKKYLRTTIPADEVSDELIDTYLEKGPEMLKYLADNSQVEYISLKMYPDYYAKNEGAREGHRSLEPKPMARSKVKAWKKMRESHQMMFAGPVSVTQREAHDFVIGSWKAPFIIIRMMATHFLDFSWRKEKQKRARRITCGAAGVGRLLWSVEDRNIPFETEVALKKLITDDAGSVIGVEAEKAGKPYFIKANKGVILACGGFEHNDVLREENLPKPSSSQFSAGVKTNTGDGVVAARDIGAKLGKMNHAWWVTTWQVPKEKAPRLSVIEKSLPGSVVVNNQGVRFANESENYMAFQHDLFRTHTKETPNDPAWMIFDRTYREENMVGPLMKYKQRPDKVLPKRFFTPEFLVMGNTIEELAKNAGIDEAQLKETIETFNGYARTGKDEQFGRGDAAYDRYYGKDLGQPNPCLGEIKKPPFYAIRSNPGDFGTGGGMVVNTNSQVLSQSGEPIKGLYATGNCTAALLPTYPGPGSTLGPAMTFGYIAGKHIK